MIDVLQLLISSLLIPLGHIGDAFVILLTKPMGFIIIFSAVLFLEYKTARSIIKKTTLLDSESIFRYLIKHSAKDVSMISPKWKLLNSTGKSRRKRLALGSV